MIFPRLPLRLLVGLLLLLGFVSGCIIIGLARAKESVPLRLTGTSSGVMILQPAAG